MRYFSACAAAMVTLAFPAAAQDAEVPYWAAINVDTINMRVGPSTSYKIEWVYTRKNLPVKVLRTREGWRYIEDHDGTKGWFLGRMLTRARHAVVIGNDLAPIREEAIANGGLKWNAEPGVIGRVGDCAREWCKFDIDGRIGWIEAARIWGEGEP